MKCDFIFYSMYIQSINLLTKFYINQHTYINGLTIVISIAMATYVFV